MKRKKKGDTVKTTGHKAGTKTTLKADDKTEPPPPETGKTP